MNYTTCKGAFADGFYDESAGNIMVSSDHARDDIVLTPWENMKSTDWLLTDRAGCMISTAIEVMLLYFGKLHGEEEVRRYGGRPKQ